MTDSTNTTISRAYSKAVRWQVIATALVAIASFAFSGVHAAFSAVLGGVVVIVGSYAGVAATAKYRGKDAGKLLSKAADEQKTGAQANPNEQK